MPTQQPTKKPRKTPTKQLEDSVATKGIVFTSKNKRNCSFVIGFEGCVYKMSGFNNYINAKLARLNMLVIFKPEYAITEIKMLIKSHDPIVTSEFRSQLLILLDEAEGKMPERVNIKSGILKHLLANVNEQKYLTIKCSQIDFEKAYKAANQNTTVVAPLLFSSELCATPQPPISQQKCEPTQLSTSPQLSDIADLPEDMLDYITCLEAPNREFTASCLSFGSEFQYRTTPELNIEPKLKYVSL